MEVLIFRGLGLLGLAILVALAARRLRLPYTVGLVLAGTTLALFRVNAGVALTHELIFDVVLPPLLFEAALNLRWNELARELAPVIALATLGVLLCAAIVAGGLIRLLGWEFEPALAFGALIAATDPIAVIALLRESRVTGRLRLLLEAESLVNDGAAAVLFALILAWAAHDPEITGGPFEAVKAFVEIAGGGLLVGLIVGLAAVLVAGTSDDHLVETALTAVAAFGSFLIAEHVRASGVLATVAAGIVMGNLGVLVPKEAFGLALTALGRSFVLQFWEFGNSQAPPRFGRFRRRGSALLQNEGESDHERTGIDRSADSRARPILSEVKRGCLGVTEFVAFLANSLVFLLIGSAMATIDFAREGWQALALAICLALSGRAAAVYLICFAFSRSRRAVPLNEQHLLWWGGMRGALALALALSLPSDLPRRQDILIVAFAVAAFSVVVQGLTAPFALRMLGLAPGRPSRKGRLGSP